MQNQQLEQLKEIVDAIEIGSSIESDVVSDLKMLLMKQPGIKEFFADKSMDSVIGAFLAVLPAFLQMKGIII